MQLARFARVRFCHLPTALEALPRLSAELGGPQLLVKRDDATGLGFGGNKTRKLEFLIGAALADGADTLVTAGGVQSNHCRQTAAAAARHGLGCALVLQRRVAWNHPTTSAAATSCSTAWPAPRCIWSSAAPISRPSSSGWRTNCARAGRRPFVIPIGGSTPIGALGYVAAGVELLAQAEAAGRPIERSSTPRAAAAPRRACWWRSRRSPPTSG